MASFPTTLKNFISKLTGGVIEASHINDLQDEVSALETKVGVDGSAVATSLDYLVKNTASVNPGHKHSTASISNFDLESPTNGQVPQYNSTSGKWEKSTVAVADASTAVKGVTKLSVAPAVADDPIAVGTNDTRLGNASYTNRGIVRLDTSSSFSGLRVDSGSISVNTGIGANQIVKLDGTGKLPAVDGSQLTGIQKKTIASNNLKASADTVRSISASGTYIKGKEIFAFYDGVVRITYDAQGNNFGVNTRIYVNEVAVGTVNTNNTASTWESYTAFDTTVSAGSRIQIYGQCTSAAFNIRNFRISYDEQAKTSPYVNID